jgi:hypothetical protein
VRARLWTATRVCLTVFLLSSGVTYAQKFTVSRIAVVPNLAQLSRDSGYIFSGTVTSVVKAATLTPGQVGTMRITFRVEQAIRGVRTGQIFTINEWVGLWDAGEHYRPGEQVMLFLYPPSRLGLTSPVGGSQGRFEVNGSGQVVLPPASINPQSPVSITPTRPSSGTAITTKSFVQAIRLAGRE